MVYGLILLFYVRKKDVTLKPDETGFTLKQRLKMSLSTGGMIGAFIVVALGVLGSYYE